MKRKLIMIALTGVLITQLTGCFPLVVAGVGAGVMVGTDRRTSGTYVDDGEIELRVSGRIRETFTSNQVHVIANSFNRSVLLTGEVPDTTTQDKIQALVRTVPDVVGVYNQLVVAAPISWSTSLHDTYLTSAVKARFIDANLFPITAVKVTTENGVVYLMGFMTHQEADESAHIASTTTGVLGVVKVFEYQ